MGDVQSKADLLRIVLLNDKDTPEDFVVELLCLVLKRPYADAIKLIDTIDKQGHAICGTHPRDIATKMLKAARQRIDAAGHRLTITSEAVAEGSEMPDGKCRLCGAFSNENRLTLRGVPTLVCEDCISEVTNNLPEVTRAKQFSHACDALNWHFAGIPRDQLVATTRQFPGHMRADVQVAVDRLFSTSPLRFFGIYEQHRYETLTFAGLTRDGRDAQAIAPAQYHDVDVGEDAPVKCLNNGLWLCRD
ncbi:ATP-dependent Clp protease adaptor ClpS, partial [Bradyrhizobium sp.]|uniref:ATP-dependent Clp protease adaptor ClpS n=1 Tax=Bradyrhizobium sp. TaxID=376 RepID=UPI0025C54867